MENTPDAPFWSLENIYPSLSSPEYESDKRRLAFISNAIRKEDDLPALLHLMDEGTAISSNLNSYITCISECDAYDEKALSESESISLLLSSFDSSMRDFYSRLDEFEDDFSLYPEYEPFFFKAKEEKKHLLSQKEEEMSAAITSYGSSAFENLQSSLTATIATDEFTLNELRSRAEDGSRSVRKESYEEEIRLLEKNEIAFSYALNGVKGAALYLDKKRNWRNPKEKSLFNFSISARTLDALFSAIEEKKGIFHSYFEERKKILSLDELCWYDLSAPIGKSLKFSFSEAMDTVISSYRDFSPEMADTAQKALSNSWIDGKMRKGKASGAFDTEFLKSGESRVFLNFDSSLSSVFTLAHELGHLYHDQVVSDKKALLALYPMSFAETASAFGEILLFEYLMKKVSGDERLSVLSYFVSSLSEIVIDIASRYYFEDSFFSERENGPLSPERISELMLRSQERAYGDIVSEKHRFMWAVKSHYYSLETPYYNYPYAFGFLLALALRKKGLDFREYRDLLHRGPSPDLSSLLSKFGFDIGDKAFWLSSFDIIERIIGDFRNAAEN